MTTQVQQAKDYRQHMRGFIAVWIGLTLLVATATFLGIYVAAGALEDQEVAQTQVIAPQNNPVPADNTQAQFTISDTQNAVPQNNAPAEGETAALSVDEQTVEESVVPAAINENADASVPPADGQVSDQSSPEDNARSVPPVDTITNAQAEATPIPTPTVAPNQETKFDLGIQVVRNFANDENTMRGYMDAAANQLNLNWVKLQVRWEFVEPEPGVYDWEALGIDQFMQLATEKNLKVLVSVVTAPDWAREPNADLTKHGPPADFQMFANFIGLMLLRYPAQIHAVEVWNEMNLDREWASPNGLSAANYTEMLRVVHDTVRAIDPNVIIVSGALSPTGVDDGVAAINDQRYMDELIAAGMLQWSDCVGAHHNGYNIGPNVPFDNVPDDPSATFRGPFDNPHPSWSFYSTLNLYASKISAAGSTVPLCVTEFGWAVSQDLDPAHRPIPNFGFAEDNTLTEQREFLVEAIQLMEAWGFVRLAIIWNLNFGPEASWDLTREYRDNIPYSLIRPNFIPAEAWAYIRDMNFRGRQ